jgi:4-hydroxy-2-oxoglutarate aldolase
MSYPTLMPALVTPFTRSGRLDLAAHEFNLTTLSALGLKGFVLAGSTGEGSLLDPGERSALTSAARALLPARHLMVGINAESTRQALSQVEEAATSGADTVLVLGPVTLARNSVDAQRRFFTEIADRSPLPTLLYSVPRNTGYALDESLALELSGHPNIVGMKDSGGDPLRIGRIARKAGTEFTMFNGATVSLTMAIAGGAFGAITASTNYLPRRMQDLVRLARSSPAKALALQDEITAIASRIEAPGIPGVKAAARAAGLRPGYPRAPFAPADRTWIRTIAPLVDR